MMNKWIEYRFGRDGKPLTEWKPIPAGGVVPEMRKAMKTHGDKLDLEMRNEAGSTAKLEHTE